MDKEKELLDFLLNDGNEVKNEDWAVQIITADTYGSIVDAVNEKAKDSLLKIIHEKAKDSLLKTINLN